MLYMLICYSHTQLDNHRSTVETSLETANGLDFDFFTVHSSFFPLRLTDLLKINCYCVKKLIINFHCCEKCYTSGFVNSESIDFSRSTRSYKDS